MYAPPVGFADRGAMFVARAAALLVGASLLSACAPTGFLITPVPLRHELVETELSRDSLFAWDKIALVEVSGIMVNAPKPQWIGEGEHPVSLLVEQLDKARSDPRVKAVVLKINSPGGTVTASEIMHAEIRRFRRSGKPVVAMMMDVAASGGYYVACACDEIIAHPSTVTGSIGVVFQMFDVTGTMNLIGVRADAIKSGAFKDAGSPLREMTQEERDVFQAIINEMHARFVSVVADGRNGLDEAQVRALADGRVHTASQALKLGLIDRVATLREGMELAKKRAGARAVRYVTYHRPLEHPSTIYARPPERSPASVNLLNLSFSFPASGGATARFLYLWLPGV